MSREQEAVRWLYSKLIRLYPRSFRGRLGESMQQTFDDLYDERRRQTERGAYGFVVWMFLETAAGIVREHVLTKGASMQAARNTIGASGIVGLLLILPLAILEVVNRQNFNEGFPFMVFFVLWFSLFAVSLLLLPIAQGRRMARRDEAVPVQGNTLLTNPRSTAIIAIVLILSPGVLPLLDSVGWLSLDRLFNGPNPEVAYLPGLIITFGLLLFPVAAGVVAGGPIVSTLRAGGSLFAHPLHLIIVAALAFCFAAGFVSLVMDQWSCFMGVPNCD